MTNIYRMPNGQRYAVTGNGFAVCAACCGEGVGSGGRTWEAPCSHCRGTGNAPAGAEDHWAAQVAVALRNKQEVERGD